MARTPEGLVKGKVVGILKDEEVYFFFPATHGFGRSGVPDIVTCINGFFVAFECKAGGNKITALQANEIGKIRRSNGIAVVVNEHNWELVRPLVRKLKTGKLAA